MKCTAHARCYRDATVAVEARNGEAYRAQAVCDHHAPSVAARISTRVGAPATTRPLRIAGETGQLDLLGEGE